MIEILQLLFSVQRGAYWFSVTMSHCWLRLLPVMIVLKYSIAADDELAAIAAAVLTAEDGAEIGAWIVTIDSTGSSIILVFLAVFWSTWHKYMGFSVQLPWCLIVVLSAWWFLHTRTTGRCYSHTVVNGICYFRSPSMRHSLGLLHPRLFCPQTLSVNLEVWIGILSGIVRVELLTWLLK